MFIRRKTEEIELDFETRNAQVTIGARTHSYEKSSLVFFRGLDSVREWRYYCLTMRRGEVEGKKKEKGKVQGLGEKMKVISDVFYSTRESAKNLKGISVLGGK